MTERDYWPEPAAPEREEAPPPVPPPLRKEPPGSAGLGVVAGAAAAVAGAVGWGLVTRWTGYETGILAWAVGIVVGYAVAWAGPPRTASMRAFAVVAALLGVLGGKYLAFAFLVQDDAAATGRSIGLLSAEMRRLFRDSLGDVFTLFDLLWAAFAAVSAWWALRPVQPAVAPRREPEPERPRRHSRNPVDRLTQGLPHGLRVAVDWLVTIVGAVAIVLAIKAWVVNPYRIPSSSMEPTLHCARPALGCEARFSDRVLANRFIYRFRDPQRGDIVVFETPPLAKERCGAGGTFVKRLVGLPGDVLEIRLIRGYGYVYIDGKRLKEPYIKPGRRDTGPELPARKIPPGYYFMMGDNRAQSCDSRVWGPVPRKNLIGKVFATYWPPNRIGFR